MIINGDCLEELDKLEENSVDAIVTDPPYELNFMGKGWDNAGVSFSKSTWEKCLRVLKPGGYLLAFGGTRTYHRIACAIEDAGFEIRDCIMWLYGAGFPKSMNIGKQLEKRLEDEKTKQKTEHDLRLMWERDLQKTKRNEKKQDEVLQPQLQEQSLQGTMYGEKSKESNLWEKEPCLERWNNIQKTEGELQRCKVCEMPKRVFINGEERWICDGTQISDGKTLREMFEQSGSCASYRPQSEQQQDRKLNVIQEQCRAQESREVIEYWNKFGTALKPSYEPIIVARKPFKGSLVDNVMENGVGGLNIDECRVDSANDANCEVATNDSVTGRFPANTILTYDDTDYDEVCGGFPQSKGGSGKGFKKDDYGFGDTATNFKRGDFKPYNDDGSAARYFYCAKASKKDRDEGLEDFALTEGHRKGNGLDRVCEFCGIPQLKAEDCHCPVKSWVAKPKKNNHPTVKPTSLMQYLIRLVSPKGSVILDPFMGSGSTGKAVMYENKERNADYTFIGIEKEAEYCKIAEARISAVK